jgi:hypothetical protein
MLDGDTQAIPGWQNRAFIKILKPIIPQRFEIMAVQAAWSPFKMPLSRYFHKEGDERDVLQVPATEAYEETSMSPPAGLTRRYHLQLPPRLLKLPEPEPEPERPQIIPEPEPSKGEPKPPVHEDEGSSSSRVGDAIDHQSRPSGSGQKPAPTPVEESQEQPVEPSREEVVTEKRVETIEKKQDSVPTSKPGDTVGRVDDKKEAAEADKPVEKSAPRRPATTWMDDDKWGGVSPRLGSTDDFFERRLLLLNRKGVEATNDLERQFLA